MSSLIPAANVPGIKVALQNFQTLATLLVKTGEKRPGNIPKDGLVETFTDPLGLGRICFS